MNVLTLNIKELSVNPNNPREIRADKFDKLIESILTFPRMLALREIVVDRGTETVALGGNMRYRALSVIADMPIDQIKNIIAGSRKYKDRTAYEVVVSCKNEADQILLMTELEERGYKCKSKSV